MTIRASSRIGVLAALAVLAAGVVAADTTAAREQTKTAEDAFRAGRIDSARAMLEGVLQQEPGYIPALQVLAALEFAGGNFEQARAHSRYVQKASWPPLGEDATEEQRVERTLVLDCEAELVMRLNQSRAEAGLPLYIPDVALAKIARGHSNEMRDLNYFSHQSPTEERATPLKRYLLVFEGARSYCIGENIASRYGVGIYSLTVANASETHADWMQSPGHRRNILDDRFTHAGIGIAVKPNGDYWATQFFAQFN